MIPTDSVAEFIQYVNRNNIPLTIQIEPSIFETNRLFIQKSIQIFQYLKMNNVELTSSLCIYAIHGNNPDIIHILEENRVQPSDITYLKCFKDEVNSFFCKINWE